MEVPKTDKTHVVETPKEISETTVGDRKRDPEGEEKPDPTAHRRERRERALKERKERKERTEKEGERERCGPSALARRIYATLISHRDPW